MRRKTYKKYLILALFLLCLMSLPLVWAQGIRSFCAACLNPFWKTTACIPSFFSSKQKALHNSCMRLESENHLLKIEIAKLKNLLDQHIVKEQLTKEEGFYESKEWVKRYEEAEYLHSSLTRAVPALVIYRDPASWASSLWIGAGEEVNEKIGERVIQKNSPVVVGRNVVGVIDYVGKKQSRVRLITDFGLKPSVRAIRGTPQNVLLIDHIEALLRAFKARTDIFLSSEESASLASALQTLKGRLLERAEEGLYLAKGIIVGRGNPLWRGSGQRLKGIGFNYDFSDDEGPARDLQTGKVKETAASLAAVSLLKVNDLLVTTGMDGVFPAGLRVAEVTKVLPLREGGYAYDIEAVPIVGNLDELYTVFILPPIGFESIDQPSM